MYIFRTIARPTKSFETLRLSPGTRGSWAIEVAVLAALPLLAAAIVILVQGPGPYSAAQLLGGGLAIFLIEIAGILTVAWSARKLAGEGSAALSGIALAVCGFSTAFLAIAIVIITTIFQPGSSIAAWVAIAAILVGLGYSGVILSIGSASLTELPPEKSANFVRGMAGIATVSMLIGMTIFFVFAVSVLHIGHWR